ncbi:PRTase-like protein [Metschnikowia bicuspidata var. bicuspidata NRRL YB-4993]|uniref:PRTase-like protein n=1 Tax=Metschnikowia bicuspidata var. bicuspidata NRRL YB-4993 TaxID=869754 RepID=A0A1A0HGE2_9ASCO|nr:PRTase-like protein [Metschnikowia bicuspidata var. bicuspidata NRRL YB-4993]OBA23060.1 PRTase-like protein [Metschnikowia bicuspidata var. bicuspidata NRRL YB-4993]
MPEKLYISYNIVHKLCQKAAQEIKASGMKVDLIIAIGGGGFIPARILRSFLKDGSKNIPIQAVGLSLYEQMGNTTEEMIGKEVVRTQWIDFGNLSQHLDTLIGKNIIIVDEVDDTRTTLHYAVSELQRDVARVEKELARDGETTNMSVFVLHNKKKPKRAELPQAMLDSGRYFVGENVDDVWIAYPWDAQDIDEHTEAAKRQGNY